MWKYTTFDARCGCRITRKWDSKQDDHHRKHIAVSDEEHAQARLGRSGRGYPDHIRRVGCQEHAHPDHLQHDRLLQTAHFVPHPNHRLEWHEDGGWTVHHEPKG